jgi:hypothetical protein
MIAMQNILFKSNFAAYAGSLDMHVNNFKIKYNQEYCVFSGHNYFRSFSVYNHVRSNAYKYISEFLNKPENSVLKQIASPNFILNEAFLELSDVFGDNNVDTAYKDNLVKTRIKELFNSYLSPSEDLKLRKRPHSRHSLKDLTSYSFINNTTSHQVSRAGAYYWGGGIFGTPSVYANGESILPNVFNPLAILAIKTEAVQLPRLASLCSHAYDFNGNNDYHYLQNKEGLFRLYLQAGFDYKDFPIQSFRKVYKNILLPFATENNIEIVTVPSLRDEFFYSLNIPVFNNSIQKAKEEREIMNKVVTEYTNSIAIEPIIESIEIETPW